MTVGAERREMRGVGDGGKAEPIGPRSLQNVKCKGKGKVKMNGC